MGMAQTTPSERRSAAASLASVYPASDAAVMWTRWRSAIREGGAPHASRRSASDASPVAACRAAPGGCTALAHRATSSSGESANADWASSAAGGGERGAGGAAGWAATSAAVSRRREAALRARRESPRAPAERPSALEARRHEAPSEVMPTAAPRESAGPSRGARRPGPTGKPPMNAVASSNSRALARRGTALGGSSADSGLDAARCSASAPEGGGIENIGIVATCADRGRRRQAAALARQQLTH